jgi:26S proteasome regulatory subunit N8
MIFKINYKEKVLGWYSTGDKFKPHDIEINELMSTYCKSPLLVLIDVEHHVSISQFLTIKG